MDDIIPYDDIAEMLKSPPTLAPRPNFFRLRAFRQHIVNVMKQVPHPGYAQHGWAGMVLQPSIFALINVTPFAPSLNPGLIAVYPPFALQPAIGMPTVNSRSTKTCTKRTPTFIELSTSSSSTTYFQRTKLRPHRD